MQHTPSKQKGFTLLEILVVMSIIAISMGMIVISLNTNDEGRDLHKQVIEFKQLLQLLVDESIFQQRDIGIAVKEDHIELLGFDESSQSWGPLSSSGKESSGNNNKGDTFKNYDFPPFAQVTLEMEDVALFLNPEEDELTQKIRSIDPLKNYQEIDVDEEEIIEPDIYIFSSGEVTPFTFEFRSESVETFYYHVGADELGNIFCIIMPDGELPC